MGIRGRETGETNTRTRIQGEKTERERLKFNP
jgi:hypothetical protein